MKLQEAILALAQVIGLLAIVIAILCGIGWVIVKIAELALYKKNREIRYLKSEVRNLYTELHEAKEDQKVTEAREQLLVKYENKYGKIGD